MRLRNLLLSAAALCLMGFTAAHAGEIARWDFENAPSSGAFCTDRVGELRAEANGDQKRIERVAGRDGGHALRLKNGNATDSDYGVLLVPDAPRLTSDAVAAPLNSLTIEVDVKLDVVPQASQIVRKSDGDSGYELYLTQTGNVGFRIKGTAGTLLATSKNRIIADGQWHHIAATWQGDMSIYNAQVRVDDIATSSTKTIGTLIDTRSSLCIGGYYRHEGNVGQRFSGAIDNLVISTDRGDLMHLPGKIDPAPAVPTGKHLMAQPGFVSAEFIADPPTTPECHAGSIAQAADGSLVAAWFGGTYEGHLDVGVWESRYDGKAWSKPKEIANGQQPDGSRYAVFNPTLFQYPKGGPMLLFYMAGPLESAWGNLQTSTDGGRTWGASQRLPKGIRGGTKNPPVLLEDGTLLCPDNSAMLKFDRTTDMGKTWLPSGTAPSNGLPAIQPAILKHRDGRLQALARSQSGTILTTWSTDHGATWSPVEKTDLPNNHSGIDATTLSDGRFLLVYNHSTVPKGKWGGPRTPLNVAVSSDGIHWDAALVLEDERGEYSYPTVIQASDGLVHVIYTWHRVRMKHAVIDPAKLVLTPIVNGEWPKKKQ